MNSIARTGTRLMTGLAIWAACVAAAGGQSPAPSVEMVNLTKALAGDWRLDVTFAPTTAMPKGLVNTGTETWRRGPGGFTLLEEEHVQFPDGEGFLLGGIWWNTDTKRFQGMECQNLLPYTCDVKGAMRDITMHWDGKTFSLDEIETSSTGAKALWHEAWSDITPTSFTQTGDGGPLGEPGKRIFTIHATRTAAATSAPPVSPDKGGPTATMQSLEKALAGRWSTTYAFEAGGMFPAAGRGTGEEVWHVGPGGYVMTEEEQAKAPFGDFSLIAFHWWDNTTNSLRGMLCEKTTSAPCDFDSYFNSTLNWDGTHLTIELRFPQGDKKMLWHEVWTVDGDTFTQTGDAGEVGGPLKRAVTIHGMRIR